MKRVTDLENAIVEFNRSYAALEAHFKAMQTEVNEYKQQYEHIQNVHNNNNNNDHKQSNKDLSQDMGEPRTNSKNQSQNGMNLNIN